MLIFPRQQHLFFNKPIVKLTRILDNSPIRKLGSAQGMIHLSDDFKEPLDDFTEYLN